MVVLQCTKITVSRQQTAGRREMMRIAYKNTMRKIHGIAHIEVGREQKNNGMVLRFAFNNKYEGDGAFRSRSGARCAVHF